ncbi:hypothetical protein ABVK25_012469 [Lepraria finkii]|uniref:PNPLA domain-containing protein n=1 Tax=Lepraria finkii TaxID=1340010 RepID=A0ABR4AKY1_9LECA
MNGSELRRTNTIKGTPLRILSLDGGGVRGYSMLILLHDFMHKTYSEVHGEPPEPDQIPKPCDYFDLIAGTGTGGLIAIMLGRLRMHPKDCMRVYVQMTKGESSRRTRPSSGFPIGRRCSKRIDGKSSTTAIKACVRGFENRDDEDVDASPISLDFGNRPQSVMSDRHGMPQRRSTVQPESTLSTQTLLVGQLLSALAIRMLHWMIHGRRRDAGRNAVTAVLKGPTERKGTTVLLRSYPSRTQPAVESDVTIWQAGRATCATKLAFKEIRVGQSTFQDEGYGLTNSDNSPTYNPRTSDPG